MKKTPKSKKLLLNRETVRNLSHRDLSRIGGGLINQTRFCDTNYCETSPIACTGSMTTNHNETLLRAQRSR